METPQRQDQSSKQSTRPQGVEADRDFKGKAENTQAGVGQTARPSQNEDEDLDTDLDDSSETRRAEDQPRPGGPSTEPKKWAERTDRNEDDAISQ